MVSSTCSENNTTAIEAKSNGTSNNEMHEVATVLTTLGSTQEISESDHKQQICLERHQAIETEDEEKFEIPQRFTKSGRKRAVSFPLKVSCFKCHCFPLLDLSTVRAHDFVML
jgi:hypothetical protein